MRLSHKYIIVFCAALLCVNALNAQIKQEEHDPDFNAMEHSMQRRHKPENDPFISESFFDNTFVYTYGGSSQLFNNGGHTYSMGASFGVGFGKRFDYVNSLRIGFAGESYIRNMDAARMTSLGLDASYLWDLTSYVGGYRHNRFCDLNIVAGMSLRNNSDRQLNKFSLGAHLGFQATMKLFKDVDFYVEPLGRFMALPGKNDGLTNWKAGNFSYAMNFGINYRFIPESASRPKVDYGSGIFLSVMGGAQFQDATLVKNNIGILNSLGPHVAFSAGKKYTDLVSLRASLFYSNDIWCTYLDDEFIFKGHYFGLRLEAMLELLHFIPHQEDKPLPVSLSLLFGPEIGGMNRGDIKEDIFTSYCGLTGGIQFKGRIAKNVSLFLEPRFSYVPYTFKESVGNQSVAERYNYLDYLYNLNLGVEIAL